MVHRKNNEETAYNYLVYDLIESGGRPRSFFGMTILLDSKQYCADFKTIFEWFEYVFEKIRTEKNIFRKDEDGNTIEPLRYNITKFSDVQQDAKWIKDTLPKIFSPSSKVILDTYDSSFSISKSGQIVGLNPDEDQDVILKAFKDHEWISISSENPVLSKEGKIDDAISELDYGDLREMCNECNATLVPIAINKPKESSVILNALYKKVSDSISSISQYVSRISDEDAEHFQKLLQNYRDLLSNIDALIKKISPAAPNNGLQYCYSCKQYKSRESFRSPDATKCKECEKKIQHPANSFKKCKECGEMKPVSSFKPGAEICDTCRHKGNPIPIKFFLLAGLFIAVVIAIIVVLTNKPKVESVSQDSSAEITGTTNHEDKDPLVDKHLFNRYIQEQNIEAAFNCIAGKKDKKQYYQDIANAIDEKLWALIDDTSHSPDCNSMSNRLLEYFTTINGICSAIEYNRNYKDWLKVAEDYCNLMTLVNKQSLSYNEKNHALSIIENYPDRFGDVKGIIEGKQLAQPQNNPDNKIEILIYDPNASRKAIDLGEYNPSKSYTLIDNGVTQSISVYINENVHIYYRDAKEISYQQYPIESFEGTRPEYTDNTGKKTSPYLRVSPKKIGTYHITCGKTRIELVANYKRL